MNPEQTVVRRKTTVQPGGTIVITDPSLQSGEAVEVLILLPWKNSETYRSALDILGDVEGHRLFQTAEEVDQYLREERDSWDS
jgi:hypothetical protein